MDLSKEELFSKFHNKIDFSVIKDYALNKVTKPTSIDLVTGKLLLDLIMITKQLRMIKAIMSTIT